MKYLITLIFTGLLFTLQAQETGTTVTVSLAEASCEEGVNYQINMRVCEPKDRNAEAIRGYQESERDWSEFNAIDNNFNCDETLTQEGCKAVFRLDGHGLDQVYNLSIVKIADGSMEMMQVLVPVQQAANQTEIVLEDIHFESRSVNLKDQLHMQSAAKPSTGKIMLSTKQSPLQPQK